MQKMIDLLNGLREVASAEYRERIPVANANNIETIQSLMLDGDNIAVANEFNALLMNKFVKSWVHNKVFKNPMKSLKKGNKPLGDSVEEIYNNFLKGTEYDPTGANLLNRNLPDTKVVYHRMNHQMQYPITVGREALRKAFLSYDNLNSYVSGIMNSLYNSAELDEFINVKNLITLALNAGAMVEIEVEDPLKGETEGKEFIKAVKTVSKAMTFPSEKFNGYLNAQSTDSKPITTFSRKDEQVLILDAGVDTSVQIDVLASAFNMSVAEFNDTTKIVIDAFADKRVRAVLVDKAFFQIFDDLFTVSEFYNGKGLYTNYYLNVWQTMAYSILVNAVAFVVPAGEDVDGDGAVEEYSVHISISGPYTMTNNKTKVKEGSSYKNTIKSEGGTLMIGDVFMGGEMADYTMVDDYTCVINIKSVTADISVGGSIND